MGVSTDAILAFGFDLGLEDEPPAFLQQEGEDAPSLDFEEFIQQEAGIQYPHGFGYGTPEYDAYYQAKKAAIEACPVDLIMHCSHEYPMYFLAVRGTESKAYRGSPTKVEAAPIEPAQVQAMREWCGAHGIEWQEPAWHIFSMWG